MPRHILPALGLLCALTAHAEITESSGFKFTADVPPHQQVMLAEDFASLPAMKLPQDPETLAMLELKEVSGTSLLGWLQERVQYIVGESFQVGESVQGSFADFTYENANEMPVLEKAVSNPTSQPPKYVVAVNIGSGIYLAGKMQDTLFEAQLPGLEKSVEIRSPRTGIVQIGAGLFQPLLSRYGWKGEDINTEISRYVRLGALFHEARHSDGQGKSLSFPHAVCPEGHDYAGRVVCDRSLNGAYAVGGLVERDLLQQCQNCTVAEKEAFRLYTMDSFNRIIHVTRTEENGAVKVTPTTFLDAAPEGKR